MGSGLRNLGFSFGFGEVISGNTEDRRVLRATPSGVDESGDTCVRVGVDGTETSMPSEV
eukprot:m.857739 g.857739  ORF g.857739 m.857739 type:complete len:59 (-) comp59650_c0_seq17:211-387(-)